MTLKICVIGDVFSDAGIAIIQNRLPAFIKENSIDFTIVNAENASGGSGLLEVDAEKIFASGADVLTGGNHIFEKREIYPYLEQKNEMLRPANYSLEGSTIFNHFIAQGNNFVPSGIPGRGFNIFKKNDATIAVLNIQGRQHLPPIDCPFVAAHKASIAAEKENAVLVIDFHAESNEEKEALAFFLDGRASLVCGTHTHVQTSDERILPKGTGYITDLGMTGVQKSVIGSAIDSSIRRNLTQILYKLENAEGSASIHGVIAEIDTKSKKSVTIQRFSYR